MNIAKGTVFVNELKNTRLSRTAIGRIFESTMILAVSFSLGICPLPLSVYPLGIAYFCALTEGAVFGFAGVLLSAFFTPISVLSYLTAIFSALVLRLLSAYFFEKRQEGGIKGFILRGAFQESVALRVSAAAVSVFTMSLFPIIQGGFRYYDLFGAILSIFITVPVILVFYGRNKGLEISDFHRLVANIAVSSAITLSLSQFSNSGINWSLTSAFFFTVLFCSKKGVIPSVAAALLCGLFSGTENIPPLLIAAFTAYCVLDVSDILAASVACIASAICGVTLVGGEYMSEPFLSLLIGAGLYCTATKTATLGEAVAKSTVSPLFSLIDKKRLEFLSNRFLAVSRELSAVEEESAELCDSVSLIRGVLSEAEEEFEENTPLSSSLAHRLYELGFGRQEVKAIGKRQTKIFIHSAFKLPKEEKIAFIKRRAEAICSFPLKLVEKNENQDGMTVIFERNRTISYHHAVSSIPKEEVCGDSIEVFYDGRSSKMYAILCDGMGSGEDANKISAGAIRLIKALLLSGMSPTASIGALSKSLSLRNLKNSEELTTTVDLLSVDLFTGDASLIKSGATPSYIRRGDKLIRYSAETAPLGILQKSGAKEFTFKLLPNDVFIMVSDGISECEDDSVPLLCYLESCGSSPEEIASDVTRLALSQGKKDDLSAAVIKFFSADY